MIVCEVGLNHLGDENFSNYYLNYLSSSNCDAISYQIREKEAYLDPKYSGYELSLEHYSSLKKKSKKMFGIALANTNLVNDIETINPDFYKILSWDLSNYDFIDNLLNKTDKQIYVSTGTSSFVDLDKFSIRYGNNNQINFIHTQLTEHYSDANLKAIKTLQEKFSYNISYGNHCNNLNLILASVVFEPKDIWFYVKDYKKNHNYFSLGRKNYPDDSWAVPLDKVDSFVKDIKEIYSSLGDGKKVSTNTKGY